MIEIKKDGKGKYIIPETFEPIKFDELRPADAILVYGGNWLTQLHGTSRRAEFPRVSQAKMVPTHALMFISIPYITLDPTIKTDLGDLRHYTSQKDSRIDIIRYNLTIEQQATVQQEALSLAQKERRYDVGGYGAFLSQMPGCSWAIKFIKPSRKFMLCSDACTYLYEEKAGFQMSATEHDYTAPIDMLIYLLNHQEIGNIKTLKRRGEIL